MMGFMDSTSHYCQEVMWAKNIALGDRRESSNTFIRERVVVNFPGSEGYDCKRHWLYKDREDGLIATDLFIYVDNRRPIGPT